MPALEDEYFALGVVHGDVLGGEDVHAHEEDDKGDKNAKVSVYQKVNGPVLKDSFQMSWEYACVSYLHMWDL